MDGSGRSMNLGKNYPIWKAWFWVIEQSHVNVLSQRVRHDLIHKWLNSPWFIALFRQITRTETGLAFSFGTILRSPWGYTPVADLWFPRQDRQPSRWGANLLFGQAFPKNFMKMKEIGPWEGARTWRSFWYVNAHTFPVPLLYVPSTIRYTTIEQFRVSWPLPFHVASRVTHEWMDHCVESNSFIQGKCYTGVCN